MRVQRVPVYFNLYVFGEDRVLLRDMHVNEVNAEANSELVVGQKLYTETVLNCNLCQVYDNASFSIVNVTIDNTENVPSATSSFADFAQVGQGIMTFSDTDLRPLFLTTLQQGVLNLFHSPHDPAKLHIIDQGSRVNIRDIGADFTVNGRAGSAPLQVEFVDQSGGAITGYLWDFGDNDTSSESDPSHTYVSPGVYPVSLRVTGPRGSDSLEKSGYIRVN